MKLTQKFAVALIRTRLRLLSFISKKKAAQKAFDLFCTPQVRHRKELPSLFTKAEQLSTSFNEYSIAGYRWNKGAGKRVMILHGFESSAINFQHFITPLVAKGYEVLAFDAPAHGRSSGTRVNAVVYADFIRFVYQQYGPVNSFIAHSFGGLALCLALSEQKANDSLRIALIAPATETSSALDHFFRFIRLNDREVRKEFENIILVKGGHPVSWFSIIRCLDLINAEILWIHDENDTITPLKDIKIIQEKNYSGIRFVITKGLGHRRIYRDPVVCDTIIDFL